MDVILNAAYRQCLHLVLPSDATQVRPKTLLKIWFNQWTPFFSSKHAMHETTHERMHNKLPPFFVLEGTFC